MCYAGTTLVFLLPPLIVEGWPAVWESFHFQLTRKSWRSPYGPLLPISLAANDAVGRIFRLGTLALTIAVLCWTRPAGIASLLRRGAVVLIVFIGLSVIFSPQWVLWLAPLLLPLARRNRSTGLFIALDLATYFTFPVYSLVWGPFTPAEWIGRFIAVRGAGRFGGSVDVAGSATTFAKKGKWGGYS